MALVRAGKLMARTFVNASRQQLPSAMHMSRRLKTYLVGVDGSGYGFSALKTVCNGANNGDEVICMYFPPNLEVQLALRTNWHNVCINGLYIIIITYLTIFNQQYDNNRYQYIQIVINTEYN